MDRYRIELCLDGHRGVWVHVYAINGNRVCEALIRSREDLSALLALLAL